MNCECPRCGSEDAYFDPACGCYCCPVCNYTWGGYKNLMNFAEAKMKKLH